MAKQHEDREGRPRGETIAAAGVVREQLPHALYRVELDGGHEILAHAPGGVGRNFVRLLVGDRVKVELSPRDVKRGRVVKKL